MSTPYYIPRSNVPLPPKDADVISTACDYCIVACGYKVYRLPVRGGKVGGPKADQNAFGVDFPVEPLGPWVAPNQYNIVLHNNEPHHVIIIPDKDAKHVNVDGNSSIRGGAIAQKVYKPQTPTSDRLKSPMVRMFGVLMPVPWDFAIDIAAEVTKHVIDVHGADAYGMKTFSYGYMENTYAISKFALRHINTGNTQAISALGIVCGAGGRPGQVIGRAGGHQRGGLRGGKYPRNKSPEKLPGRRRRALDTDRYMMSGHTRLAHVIGNTWIQSMCGSQGLSRRFNELTVQNPHQIMSFDKADIIDTLKKRADSGGMVVFNQDIYLVDPIGARFADIVFSAAGWGEDTFTRANGERRLRLYPKFYDPPGEAEPDWWIMAELGKRMGFDGFDWKNSNDVLEEAARRARGSRKDFFMVKVAAQREGKTLHQKFAEFGTDGIQGPVLMKADGSLAGWKRLHDTTATLPEDGPQGANVFNKNLTRVKSQTGKCNIQKAPWSLFSDYWKWLKPREGELWCTSGRINERWQSGYDDRRRPYIVQRWPENWVELHPDDAKARGIESGDYVMLYSDRIPEQVDTIIGVEGDDFQFTKLLENGHIRLSRAAITAVAIVTPAVKKNVAYMDFLHTSQPANALAGRVVDWISGNYNYKMGVGMVKKIGVSPYKNDFRSMSFARRDIA